MACLLVKHSMSSGVLHCVDRIEGLVVSLHCQFPELSVTSFRHCYSGSGGQGNKHWSEILNTTSRVLETLSQSTCIHTCLHIQF